MIINGIIHNIIIQSSMDRIQRYQKQNELCADLACLPGFSERHIRTGFRGFSLKNPLKAHLFYFYHTHPRYSAVNADQPSRRRTEQLSSSPFLDTIHDKMTRNLDFINPCCQGSETWARRYLRRILK